MQVAKSSGAAKPSTLSVITGVIKNEGITTLYNGLSAGLLRQATYTTTRLGIYTWLFEKFSTDGKPPNFAMKAGLGKYPIVTNHSKNPLSMVFSCNIVHITIIGMTAGGSAAFVGTPAEVALIRSLV